MKTSTSIALRDLVRENPPESIWEPSVTNSSAEPISFSRRIDVIKSRELASEVTLSFTPLDSLS
jgi:hypothetical protein